MRRGFRGLSQLGGLNLSLESSMRDLLLLLPTALVPDHVHVAHPLAATRSSPSRWPTVAFGAAASTVKRVFSPHYRSCSDRPSSPLSADGRRFGAGKCLRHNERDASPTTAREITALD